jgi:hypothetical protein
MAAHVRFAVHCRLGRLPDSNPGLQVYSLALLPISHYCSQIKDLFQKLNILLFSFHMILNNSLTLCCHTVLSWTLCAQHKPKVPVSISWGYHAPGTAVLVSPIRSRSWSPPYSAPTTYCCLCIMVHVGFVLIKLIFMVALAAFKGCMNGPRSLTRIPSFSACSLTSMYWIRSFFWTVFYVLCYHAFSWSVRYLLCIYWFLLKCQVRVIRQSSFSLSPWILCWWIQDVHII